MEISLSLREANARLRQAKVGMSIDREGSSLRLRAILPPRQGEGKNKQQRIHLGIRATLQGVKQAELEACIVRRDLDTNKFKWEKYIKPESKEDPQTVEDWIEAFEEDYFNRRKKTHKTLTTWKTEYCQVFPRLPQSQQLTVGLLKEAILKVPPDTKTRKRVCICLGALAKFAGVDFDAKRFAGSYNPKSVKPRDIPEDRVIVECFDRISSGEWRWVFGMLAAFGLRNHEVFRVDFPEFVKNPYICSILEGKTGPRRVWPFHPEWIKRFDLASPQLPAVNLDRSNSGVGHEVTQYFYRHKMPFPAYTLRHAWAIRTLEYGLDISLASQQMGHSLKVHSDLYHHWISDRQHQRAFELLMKRGDRPLPPD